MDRGFNITDALPGNNYTVSVVTRSHSSYLSEAAVSTMNTSKFFFSLFFKQDAQHTRVTRIYFIHIYVHRMKGSCKWALNSKPCDQESEALPLHSLRVRLNTS